MALGGLEDTESPHRARGTAGPRTQGAGSPVGPAVPRRPRRAVQTCVTLPQLRAVVGRCASWAMTVVSPAHVSRLPHGARAWRGVWRALCAPCSRWAWWPGSPCRSLCQAPGRQGQPPAPLPGVETEVGSIRGPPGHTAGRWRGRGLSRLLPGSGLWSLGRETRWTRSLPQEAGSQPRVRRCQAW